MLNIIDISNWQGNLDPDAVYPNIDGVIAKATEGTGFVDGYCDGFVQAAKRLGKVWGFYHFAGDGNATEEADYFYDNCAGYFHDGVPILDWEGNQDVAWVNEFVNRIHERTGVWCWIYANPWRFNQGGVEQNCARWVASYPDVSHPSFDYAACCDCPEVDGLVCAWQFCSDGLVNGYDGELDCSIYYGDEGSWRAYADASDDSGNAAVDSGGVSDVDAQRGEILTVENEEYVVTVQKK